MLKNVLLLNANLPGSTTLTSDYYSDIASNVGNSYIAQACSEIFAISDLRRGSSNYIFQNHANLDLFAEQARSATAIILVLQDHLRVDFPDDWYVNGCNVLACLDRLDAPLLTLSLSANSFQRDWELDLHTRLSPVKTAFMKMVSERSTSIGVRGEFAAHVLGNLGIKNVEVVGCPSYFAKGEDRVVMPARRDALSGLRLGVTGAFRPRRHEAQALYLLQGDAEWPMVELLYDQTRPAEDYDPSPYGTPLLNPLVLASLENRVKIFSNARQWEDYISKNCFAVAGTRLHGAIVALNAGVPAVVTNGDARARESCEYLGIPWMPNGIDPDADLSFILDCCDVEAVNGRYNKLYAHFAGWATSNGFPVSPRASRGFEAPQLASAPVEIVVKRAAHVLGSDDGVVSRLLERLVARADRDDAQREEVLADRQAGAEEVEALASKLKDVRADLDRRTDELARERSTSGARIGEMSATQRSEFSALKTELDAFRTATNASLYNNGLLLEVIVRRAFPASPLTTALRTLGRALGLRTSAPRYFDATFYVNTYLDVLASRMDPFDHYVRFGAAEGRNPNPMFDGAWYVAAHSSDVPLTLSTAFEHFLTCGLAEGRQPHRAYTAAQFRARYMP